MDKEDRELLEALQDKLYDLKRALESLRDKEQVSFDKMSDLVQDRDKGRAVLHAVSSMDEAISSLHDAERFMDNATA